MRPCFLQKQWSKKERIQNGSHSLTYINLRSDRPSLLLYFIGYTGWPWNSIRREQHTVWIPQDRDHWGLPLRPGYIRYHGLKCLEVTSFWWPVTGDWLGMKCESPAPLPQGESNSVVYFMLQNFPWDQAEAETSHEFLPSVDLYSFPVLPLLFPHQLPVSPGSTSLINYLHLNPYVKVCFWEIPPWVRGCVCLCTCWVNIKQVFL